MQMCGGVRVRGAIHFGKGDIDEIHFLPSLYTDPQRAGACQGPISFYRVASRLGTDREQCISFYGRRLDTGETLRDKPQPPCRRWRRGGAAIAPESRGLTRNLPKKSRRLSHEFDIR